MRLWIRIVADSNNMLDVLATSSCCSTGDVRWMAAEDVGEGNVIWLLMCNTGRRYRLNQN